MNVDLAPGELRFGMVTVSSGLLDEIKAKQKTDEELIEKRNLVTRGKAPEFTVGNDDILRCKGRVCVPKDAEMRKLILDEGHKSRLSIHPGATKMYQDLKASFLVVRNEEPSG